MKKFFVVGGSSGIGKQLVIDLAQPGNQVFATWRTTEPPRLEGISFHQLDVLESDSKLDYLPEELDGFVYCPGAIQLKPFPRLKPEDFLEDYQLQVLGAVKLLQKILPRLKKSAGSSVLFFSTVAVQCGLGFHALVSASKGAIEGLTRSLAAEFAPGIRVNCIAPSITDTPLSAGLLSTEEKRSASTLRHPLKRIGSVNDISKAAVFLLTQADWITGQVLHVDGGLSNLKT